MKLSELLNELDMSKEPNRVIETSLAKIIRNIFGLQKGNSDDEDKLQKLMTGYMSEWTKRVQIEKKELLNKNPTADQVFMATQIVKKISDPFEKEINDKIERSGKTPQDILKSLASHKWI